MFRLSRTSVVAWTAAVAVIAGLSYALTGVAVPPASAEDKASATLVAAFAFPTKEPPRQPKSQIRSKQTWLLATNTRAALAAKGERDTLPPPRGVR